MDPNGWLLMMQDDHHHQLNHQWKFEAIPKEKISIVHLCQSSHLMESWYGKEQHGPMMYSAQNPQMNSSAVRNGILWHGKFVTRYKSKI